MLEIQIYTKDKIPDVLDFEKDCAKRKTSGDGKSIRTILKPLKIASRINALTIPFPFWHMTTARSSVGSTLR